MSIDTTVADTIYVYFGAVRPLVEGAIPAKRGRTSNAVNEARSRRPR